MTIRFLAGLTKFANMPSNITKKLMESNDTKLTYFHFLFEAEDISVTAESLGSDEIVGQATLLLDSLGLLCYRPCHLSL